MKNAIMSDFGQAEKLGCKRRFLVLRMLNHFLLLLSLLLLSL